MDFTQILKNLPEVKGPVEKKLSFNIKLKWTLIVLIGFFVLANISLFGLASNALERFEYLAIIMGTDFGSIISLGIGPIVMASIILQLLVGSKILDIDVKSEEGKKADELKSDKTAVAADIEKKAKKTVKKKISEKKDAKEKKEIKKTEPKKSNNTKSL